ncbi:hypothetical protein Ahu01nite_046000 [Winogradskya humida]|uniref:DUF402 domain-containing protein n=2 Tax=Winogradskya humida TaxID=113566 RepID=A0ABQ3ZSG2_9ACTN|nr:hypothetical protein Ahu01nite_046000 [Actinoplanes humidus]
MLAPGTVFLYRNIDGPRLASVRPCRVVSDDERGLLLWLTRGTTVIVEETLDGRGIRDMPFTEWVTQPVRVVPSVWQGPGLLKFIPPGADHSVWFFQDEQEHFKFWYVNLEERALRWDDNSDGGGLAGVDVIDQDLDIVVRPDRTWQWKDEDELAERLALPDHYWVHDEDALRAEGLRVIKQIEAGDFPFDGTWTDFRPDPSWQAITDLPTGWDRPPVPRP